MTALGLRKEDDGTLSLRRTTTSIIDRATENFRAVQIPLDHTKIESTVRSIGVDIEDAPPLAEGTELLDSLGLQHGNAEREVMSLACDRSDSNVGWKGDRSLRGGEMLIPAVE